VKGEMMDGNKDNIESDSTHVEAALTQKAENQKKLIDDCDETVKGGFVTLGLGDPKYFPSKEEVNDTIQSLCLSLTKFKYYLYLVYIHQMYKFEPYNCKTISEFVSKYLEVSRATVYRAIVEISVNIAIYDSYDWKSPKINCNICQKLNRILQTQSVHFLKVFWLNLNKKCGSEITAKKVEQEIYHYIRFNRFSDSDTHKSDLKIPTHLKPQSIQSFESKYSSDNSVKPDKGYVPYSCDSDESEDESENESEDEFEDESEDESEDEFEDESEDESELTYLIKTMIGDATANTFGVVYTRRAAECIQLLLKMHPVELIAIVDCAEQILAARDSSLSQVETD